jgi:hypothetical protein
MNFFKAGLSRFIVEGGAALAHGALTICVRAVAQRASVLTTS